MPMGRRLYKVGTPEGGIVGVILDFALFGHCAFWSHGNLSNTAKVHCEKILEWVANEYRYAAESGALLYRASWGFSAIEIIKTTKCQEVKIAQAVHGLDPDESWCSILCRLTGCLFLTGSARPMQSTMWATFLSQRRDGSLRKFNYCFCLADP